MISDPWFYAVAVPAVMLSGLSKGGFGGAFGFAAVPLMSLAVSPVQAAGIMLPILLVMDVVAVSSFHRLFDKAVVMRLLPAGLAGTALGWATASLVPDDVVRLIVGVVALSFLAKVLRDRRRRARALSAGAAGTPAEAAPASRLGAAFWGTLSGYTSFVAHAGGPPFQAHVVPLRLDPVTFSATSAVFFAVMNVAKIGPYLALGQFDMANLSTTATLFPVAIASTWIGVRLVRVVREDLFYAVLYVGIGLIGLKLVSDGLGHVLAGS
jgi:uncharacterized membrane protein YfcA